MKRKQKSKKALLALFEREGYERYKECYVKGNYVFNDKMFILCGLEFEVYENKGIYDFNYNGFGYIEEWLEPIEEPMKYYELGRVFYSREYGWCVVREGCSCDSCILNDKCRAETFETFCDTGDRYVRYHKLTESELNGGMKIECMFKPKRMLSRIGCWGVAGFTKTEITSLNELDERMIIPMSMMEVQQ